MSIFNNKLNNSSIIALKPEYYEGAVIYLKLMGWTISNEFQGNWDKDKFLYTARDCHFFASVRHAKQVRKVLQEYYETILKD